MPLPCLLQVRLDLAPDTAAAGETKGRLKVQASPLPGF